MTIHLSMILWEDEKTSCLEKCVTSALIFLLLLNQPRKQEEDLVTWKFFAMWQGQKSDVLPSHVACHDTFMALTQLQYNTCD